MSAMDFKKNTDLDFPSYATPAVSTKEIDLLGLLDILLAAKKRIIAIAFAFALAGLAIAFLLPQKWTSKAVITPAEQTQWNPLRQMMVALQVLDVDVKVSRDEVFGLFIKKFQSQSLLEEYMKSSPYVMSQLEGTNVDPLELDRVRLTNIHNTNLQRLNYSLEVANAAGIKKPVYSNGQAVKDDPDYSVALGADGIAQKLQIEKNLKDVSELNADFQNREYYLAQLKKLSVEDVKLEPFKYQLSPSMPVKKDGPGKALIVMLAGILGGLFACGSVLLREAMLSRNPLPEPVAE